MRVVRISSVKREWAVSWKVTNTTGMISLAVICTQGISPFDDRAGAAEWQTSSVLSMSTSFPAMPSENDDRGVTRVNARTIRRMMDILRIDIR